MAEPSPQSPAFEITTAKRRKKKKPIVFSLDGDTYTFTPPKMVTMTLDMIDADDELERVQVMFDWLGNGMSEEDTERLIGRLRDPEDDLDVEELNQIVEGLMTRVGGRPTTSPSASKA